MTINLEKHLNDYAPKQEKYSGTIIPFNRIPIAHRQKYILEITSYIMEELAEVNRECQEGVSRYKRFKKSVPVDKGSLGAEIADIFVYWSGLVAAAGLTGEEMCAIISEKMGYNDQRTDHIVK